jgi:hypothetical protein
MNNLELIKNFMTKGMTPKGIVMQMMGKNPIFRNLINMAEKGDNKGVEEFAKNILKERGFDLNKELANFKNNFK